MTDDQNAYRKFEAALEAVLAETAYDLGYDLRRHSRLANARSKINMRDPRYDAAVNRADAAIAGCRGVAHR